VKVRVLRTKQPILLMRQARLKTEISTVSLIERFHAVLDKSGNHSKTIDRVPLKLLLVLVLVLKGFLRFLSVFFPPPKTTLHFLIRSRCTNTLKWVHHRCSVLRVPVIKITFFTLSSRISLVTKFIIIDFCEIRLSLKREQRSVEKDRLLITSQLLQANQLKIKVIYSLPLARP